MGHELSGPNQAGFTGGNQPGPYPIPAALAASAAPGPAAVAGTRRRTRRFLPTTDADAAEGTRPAAEGTRPAARALETDETHPPEEVAPKPRATRQSKKDIAKRQVTLLLDTANSMASTLVAPAAAMRPYEREMIELPLHAYAEAHTATVEKVAEVAAPLVCLTGLALWLKRVLALSGNPVAIPAFRRPRVVPANVSPIHLAEAQRTQQADEQPPVAPSTPGPRITSIDELRNATGLQI